MPELPFLLFFFDRPFLVIAHRGASSLAPENTLAAFKKAVEAGADMIELDVQFSADGVPVVFHDEQLAGHTNATGSILELEFHQIKKLDAGSWFSQKYKGERIPSLQEVLTWAKNKILLNIEIKAESISEKPEAGIEEKVVQLVKENAMEAQVLISSFDYRALKRIIEMQANIKTGVLYNKSVSGDKMPAELVHSLGADAFHCSKEEISDVWADQLTSAGIPFLVYTVNEKAAMETLIDKGAAGIFSDKPGLLRKTADKKLQTGR